MERISGNSIVKTNLVVSVSRVADSAHEVIIMSPGLSGAGRAIDNAVTIGPDQQPGALDASVYTTANAFYATSCNDMKFLRSINCAIKLAKPKCESRLVMIHTHGCTRAHTHTTFSFNLRSPLNHFVFLVFFSDFPINFK